MRMNYQSTSTSSVQLEKAEELNPFDYQAPTEISVEKIKRFREACKNLHDLIQSGIPISREKSLAVTKLEEVSMWGNKAIVFNQ